MYASGGEGRRAVPHRGLAGGRVKKKPRNAGRKQQTEVSAVNGWEVFALIAFAARIAGAIVLLIALIRIFGS